MAQAQDVEIPVPLSSGATDQPTAVQHGVPAKQSGGVSTAPDTLPADFDFKAAKIATHASAPDTLPADFDFTGAKEQQKQPPAAQPKAPAYAPTPGLIPRIVGEATEAYHHPWEAAKGLGKGLLSVAQAALPSNQTISPSADVQDNPLISSRVKGLLKEEPQEEPGVIGRGYKKVQDFVRGVTTPQNPAQQGGYDVAQAYGLARGGYEMGKGAAGVIESVRPGTLPKLLRPSVPQPNTWH